MKLFDSLVVALKALTANKLRSALTLIGLVVGVSAVIILMSVGRGVQASITSAVSDLGSDVLYVMPGRPMENPLMAGMAAMGRVGVSNRSHSLNNSAKCNLACRFRFCPLP